MTLRPSDVKLFAKSWIPLTDTFGRVEREIAAAFIVQTCVAHGDTWQPVSWKKIAATMREVIKDGPWKEVAGNPFARPDIHDLIAKGFAQWVGEKEADGDQAVEFTENGFAILEKDSAKLRDAARAGAER